MSRNLLRVEWGRLTHAYGHAHGVPDILVDMVSTDPEARARGWDSFWGAVNHQGDYYDSTVAAIPFLLEAVANPEVPDRASILNYFRDRWRDAPEYGGDPVLSDPPGGIDEPTPLLTDAEFEFLSREPREEHETTADEDEEFDIDVYRRMDLSAWQTGRAIQAGQPIFVKLVDDPNLEVAAAAAALLLLWPEHSEIGKHSLLRTIDAETDPVEQARRILEFGVSATIEDAAIFESWINENRHAEVRAAALLARAWAIDPSPLPDLACRTLDDVSAVDCDAFARLPWEGIYHRGPWILPGNAAVLILRLADNAHDELRWRAVQGLERQRATARYLSTPDIAPVLERRLSDQYVRVRGAAAFALSQQSEEIFNLRPDVVPALIHALDDTSASVCGHAARFLGSVAYRLAPAERLEALAAIDSVLRSGTSRGSEYVTFISMGVQLSNVLKEQRRFLAEARAWTLADLFAQIDLDDKQDGRLSKLESDRKLAEAYARDPAGTIEAAMTAVRDESRRAASMGAANWLATLGPAARQALEALDGMAVGALDSYAQSRARAASDFIRRAVLVNSNKGDITPPMSDDVSELVSMLSDETSLEVGISGDIELEGRIYHWRLERRCPRVAAIRALFQIGVIPEGGRMLKAMLAEATHAAVICARLAVPHRFSVDEWRSAVNVARGLSVADPMIRAARQRCRDLARSGLDSDGRASAALSELDTIVNRLSGRSRAVTV